MKISILKLFWLWLIFANLMLAYHFTFAAILDAGANYTCGIQDNDSVKCAGWWRRVKMEPVKDNLLQVSVGYSHACGIRTDDQTAACWARSHSGSEAIPPNDRFSQISAGGFHTCGIRTNDQTVVCWGSQDNKNDAINYGQANPPTGTFLQVSAGRWYTCGIQTDKTVVCWGLNRYGETKPPKGTFSYISAAKFGWHTCGIKTDNTVVCWGLDDQGQSTPPAGGFSQISAGKWHTCGIQVDNHNLVCWGNNNHGQADSHSGSFSYVSAGLFHTCALQTNLTPLCWGFDTDGSTRASSFIPLKLSTDNYVCFFYAALKKGIFTIDSETIGVNVFDKLNNIKFNHMDIHPLTNQLYGLTPSNKLYYQNEPMIPTFTELGKIEIRTNGLTFHPDGTLWGWSSGKGLFQIQNNKENKPNLNKIEIVLPYNGKIKIEDITWNNKGTIIYGIENLYEKQNSDKEKSDENQFDFKGARLFAYNMNEKSVYIPCDELMSSLKKEVIAMETQPDDKLLFGFDSEDNLTFSVIDLKTCEMTSQIEALPSDYGSGLKSIAWPKCNISP